MLLLIHFFFDKFRFLSVMMLINLQLESIPSMVAGVFSNDNNMQLEATTQFRKLLSIGNTIFFLSLLLDVACVQIIISFELFHRTESAN